MKRKALALIAISAILFLLLVRVESVKSDPKTIVVPDDYLQIQEAIDAANEGDTIFVEKGYYVENPVIDKSVSLVGEDRDTTVIDVTAGLKIEADNVTVTDLTIFDGYEGISASANYCSVSGNKIVDSDSGVVLLGGENNIVAGNIFESLGPAGAVVLYSDNNIVNNNYINSCTEGIQLRSDSSFNVIKENIVTNCKNVAVRLLGGGSGRIWHYPNNNTIMRNEISNSGCGITIYGSNNNLISNNNFVNNTYQFSADEEYFILWGGSVSVNTIEENFWSSYDGTDADGDGMGDMPYVLDENNVDSYPLMKPVSIPNFPESTPSPEPTIPTSPTPLPSEKPQQLGQEAILGVVITVAVLGAGLGLLVYLIKRK